MLILALALLGPTATALAPSASPQELALPERHRQAWNEALARVLGHDSETAAAAAAELADLAAETTELEDDYLARRLVLEARFDLPLDAGAEDFGALVRQQLDRVDALESWVDSAEGMSIELRAACRSDLAQKLERIHAMVLAVEESWGSVNIDRSRLETRITELHRRAVQVDRVPASVLVATARWEFAQGGALDDESLERLDQALELDPDLPAGLVLRACWHLHRGQEYRAEQDLERASQSGVLSTSAILQQVAKLMERRDNEALAIDLLEEAAQETGDAELWYAVATRELRRIDAALAETAGPSGSVRLADDRARELSKRFALASGSEYRPRRATAHHHRATLLLGLGEHRSGLEALGDYLEESSRRLPAWLAARDVLREALREEPERALVMLESLYAQQGRDERPGRHWPAAVVLASEYARAGDLTQTKKLMLVALEDVADQGDDLRYVDDVSLPAIRSGAFDDAQVESLRTYLNETMPAPARSRLLVTRAKLDAEEERAALQRAMQALGAMAARARSYDPNLEVWMEMTEYYGSLASNPNGFGGVPMARWIDTDLDTHTLLFESN